MGIPFLCLMISGLSLVLKLIKFQKNKYRLIRPILTILVSGSLCSIAGYSYSVAQDEAKEIYKKIDAQCKQESKCPKKINGWERFYDDNVYRTVVGNYITYPITYHHSETTFKLVLHKSLDLEDTYEGGSD
ncbi:hypothetical protein [Zooshikella sp. RANM57]|uniref:hypothetical protein n=1 Tax=Zooshikella sp. RANM57 TaxID=3425863 RepID=UPI003D6E242F